MPDQPNSSPTRRIPDFASRDEEAAWWDTHDLTDYLDALEPVDVRFAPNFGVPIAGLLDPQDRLS